MPLSPAAVVCLYVEIALAVHTPPVLRGPDISLDPHILPYYAGLSIVRMAVAYLLSLLFALLCGWRLSLAPCRHTGYDPDRVGVLNRALAL